ncbi:MAG: tetratricopeptide repeat protein [Elusimicrobiota bacterium]
MKTIMVIAALFYGTYWYASRHYKFEDTLVYAKKNPKASWAPAVDYYVGLVYYHRGDYKKSQEALSQLVTDYTTGEYTAKGLIKLSEVAEENRDWPTARQSLERLIEDFPGDKKVAFAKQRLELIRFK